MALYKSLRLNERRFQRVITMIVTNSDLCCRVNIDVRFLIRWDGRYGAKPNFHSRSFFSENLIAIEMRKLKVKFNKPIYIGMCILDISKICLYEFHHEYMAPLFRKKCKVMYIDTNLIYHIGCVQQKKQLSKRFVLIGLYF